MSFDSIRETVMQASKTEAHHIVDVARKHAHQHLQAQKEAAREESERIFESRARAIDEEYSRKFVQIKGRLGKDLLMKRNAKIQEVFEMARQAILAMSDNEYKVIMKELVERVVGKSGGAFRVHPDDFPVFQVLADELNRNRESGNEIILDKSQPLSQRGGFIFASREFEVDHTLKSIMDEIERELLPEVARELFAE